jgi:hypothetical protein
MSLTVQNKYTGMEEQKVFATDESEELLGVSQTTCSAELGSEAVSH